MDTRWIKLIVVLVEFEKEMITMVGFFGGMIEEEENVKDGVDETCFVDGKEDCRHL